MVKNILVFGASSVYGAWDKEGGWVVRLRKFVDKEYRKDDDNFVLIYNLGISGDTTKALLKRFESETIQRKEEDIEKFIFIFDIGKNDASFYKNKGVNRVLPEEFNQNLRKLIKIAKKYSKVIIFLNITPVKESLCNPWVGDLYYENKHVDKYNKILDQVCKQNKLRLVNLNSHFKKKIYRNFLSKDGLHLNSKGHQKIFEIVKKALEKNKII